jgi:sugar (pentulose or hexulose) kinase
MEFNIMSVSGDLILGIDSSTTACKAVVFDISGRVIVESSHPIPLVRLHPDWHEQLAEDWWLALQVCLRSVTQTIAPERFAALSIAHQRESFVLVGDQNQPLRNAILWMDERSRSQMPVLEEKVDRKWFHAVTGKPLSGNLSFSKLYWLLTNEPDIYEKIRFVADVQAYLVYCLTGKWATGWGSADPMGLFDMRTNTWSAELLSFLHLTQKQMPEAFPPGSNLGVVSNQASALTGLPAGLPVIAGLGDGQAAGVGTHVIQSGEAYLSLGTSTIGGVFSNQYLTSTAFRSMGGGEPNTYLFETVLLGGTYTIDWFLNQFGGSITDWENQAAAIQPGANGLMLVPYWNSAMNPYWDASASGIVIGWRGHHTPVHIYRAVLEGIAFEKRLHFAGVEDVLKQPIQKIIAVGGGAKSTLWRQILADILTKPIYTCDSSQAAALGTAVIAAVASGWYPTIAQAAEKMVTISPRPTLPDPERQSIYSRLFKDVYSQIFPSLQHTLHSLAEITDNSAF